jgi:hypothetical protein
MANSEYIVFNQLLGNTSISVKKQKSFDSDRDNILLFELSNGEIYRFEHDQDCCEAVYIEDIDGDLKDLEGFPLLMAEVVIQRMSEEEVATKKIESGTWSFYKFATIKGSVVVRWLGLSNGCYAETVKLIQVKS